MTDHAAPPTEPSPSESLSLSMGAATAQAGDALSEVLRRADDAMYAEKRQFYGRR